MVEEVSQSRYHLTENRGGVRQPPGDEHAVVGAADLQDVRRERPREPPIPHPVSRPAGQQAWRRGPKRRRDGRPIIEHWCVWLASV